MNLDKLDLCAKNGINLTKNYMNTSISRHLKTKLADVYAVIYKQYWVVLSGALLFTFYFLAPGKDDPS